MRTLGNCPMVVHSERDQSEHGHVKVDVPSRVGTLDAILVFTISSTAKMKGGGRTMNSSDECSEAKR